MSVYNKNVAKVVLENAPRTAKYISYHVQKDILHTCLGKKGIRCNL
jgi:hypothetical protein